MRFWGKIKGTEYDYYVVEGKKEGAEGGDDEEGGVAAGKEPNEEARGSGCNEFVYWVCNSPLEHWT